MAFCVRVIPLEIQDRFREFPALLVQILDLDHQFDHDVAVGLGLPGGINGLVTPLGPTAAVG